MKNKSAFIKNRHSLPVNCASYAKNKSDIFDEILRQNIDNT